KATVVAASAALAFGSTAGVGASVGVAVARNLIGENVDSGMASDKTTTDTLPATLTKGERVKIASGARAGDIYQYVGGETTKVYDFTSKDGSQPLQKGDLVRVARDYDAAKAVPGDIYRYVGSGGSVDLSSEDYTGGNWAQVGSGELSAQDYNNDNLW